MTIIDNIKKGLFGTNDYTKIVIYKVSKEEVATALRLTGTPKSIKLNNNKLELEMEE